VRDLTELGRAVDVRRPVAPERIATAVMERVATLPAPDAVGDEIALPARVLRRLRIALESRRRRVALVIAAVALALLATPPVRAAVADWFGFGGVVVEHGTPRPGTPAPPPEVAGDLSPAEAAEAVGFTVFAPELLGPPDDAGVSDDGRVVSMSWSDTGEGVVRLDQFDALVDFAAAKRTPEVYYASIGGSDALWFEEPHDVVLLESDGSRRTESARLAGNTLVWIVGSTTLRLEGELSLEQAVEIAESAAPVG
jgi:hypothetical protein